MRRFRGRLVFIDVVYHSTLGVRVIKKKRSGVVSSPDSGDWLRQVAREARSRLAFEGAKFGLTRNMKAFVYQGLVSLVILHHRCRDFLRHILGENNPG